MKFEDFAEQMAEQVRRVVCAEMTAGTTVTVQRVLKNNSTAKTAICILEPGSKVSPTIYLDVYYARWQEGEPLSGLADELVEEYRRNSGCYLMEVKRLASWEEMKECTACKLIHAESNRELLADLPHRRFLDCALVYYLELSDPVIGDGTALIHARQLELWQVTEEELYRQAYQNTKEKQGCRIRSLNQIMREAIRQQLWEMADGRGMDTDTKADQETIMRLAAERMEEELCSPGQELVYLMTNRDQYFGAVTLIYNSYLQQFADRFSGGVYVLAASIHEALLIPETAGFTSEELNNLIRAIHEELAEDEPQNVLSDRIYYYDPRKQALTFWMPDPDGRERQKTQKEFTESPEFGG